MSAILSTFAYFDLFDYPLTTFEVWKWLWSDDGQLHSFIDVERSLLELKQANKVDFKNGFWFLKGRESLVEERHNRHRSSIAKFARARRVARRFSVLPWVEGIAVCNSLGYHNATPKSDIDLLVIVRPGTIWLSRLIMASALALLGQRPTAEHSADTICLSFFITRESMNLELLKKGNSDPYLTYWMTQLVPLVGRRKVWDDFWSANGWVRNTLPNAQPYRNGSPWVYRERTTKTWPAVSIVEAWAKQVQLLRLPKNLRDLAARGETDVVVNDQMLKFHANDRRSEYLERWQQATARLVATV